jgi:hypothetical protein
LKMLKKSVQLLRLGNQTRSKACVKYCIEGILLVKSVKNERKEKRA